MPIRKAAVLADIHSNYQAFKACVEDGKKRGAGCFVFLGDYVSDLADPGESLDLVYELMAGYPCYAVRGNRDGYMLACEDGTMEFSPGSKSGSLLYTYRKLRRKDLDFLRSLPIYQVIELWGVRLEIAHATADRDRWYFDEADGNIGPVFERMQTPLMLTGHSHKQYIQEKEGKTIINPGSVGVPVGPGRLTQYAMLEIEDGGVRCQLLQVPYDLREVVNRQYESGLVDMAPYWAIGVLYDLITGENWSMALLERINAMGGDVHNEQAWKDACLELGIPLEREQLLALCGM